MWLVRTEELFTVDAKGRQVTEKVKVTVGLLKYIKRGLLYTKKSVRRETRVLAVSEILETALAELCPLVSVSGRVHADVHGGRSLFNVALVLVADKLTQIFEITVSWTSAAVIAQ